MRLMTYSKASFMCKSGRSVPRLYLEPEYDFDFALIFAAWTQERLEDGLDLICYFGTWSIPKISIGIDFTFVDQT